MKTVKKIIYLVSIAYIVSIVFYGSFYEEIVSFFKLGIISFLRTTIYLTVFGAFILLFFLIYNAIDNRLAKKKNLELEDEIKSLKSELYGIKSPNSSGLDD